MHTNIKSIELRNGIPHVTQKKSYGQLAYETFLAAAKGDPETWDDLHPSVRKAWCEAALAAINMSVSVTHAVNEFQGKPAF